MNPPDALKVSKRRRSVGRWGAAALVLLGMAMTVGCVSPGTGGGRLFVEGRILTPSGDPIPGLEVEVLLPQAYGVREKELAAGQAMDFGAPRRELRVVTDAEGRFSGDLGVQSYAVDIWVMPPRGEVPPAPPPPAFLVRLPEISDENYYISTMNGACRVMRPDGAPIALSDSHLVGSEATAETVTTPNPGSATRARIELVLEATGV